jgi:hypothetical protein
MKPLILILAATGLFGAGIAEKVAPPGTYKPAERAYRAFTPRKNVELRATLPAADRATLIRRVTYDLHGLPPTPEEIGAFVKDPAPKAWENLVERLPASPRYGEQWGRHWLDVVRFAESDGYEYDTQRPDAYRFRDYVVQSFSEDKPYSQFVKEQLAGDEPDPNNETYMVASGFNRLGPLRKNAGNQNVASSRNEVLTETIATLSAAATRRRDLSSKIPRTALKRCVIPAKSGIDPGYSKTF